MPRMGENEKLRRLISPSRCLSTARARRWLMSSSKLRPRLSSRSAWPMQEIPITGNAPGIWVSTTHSASIRSSICSRDGNPPTESVRGGNPETARRDAGGIAADDWPMKFGPSLALNRALTIGDGMLGPRCHEPYEEVSVPGGGGYSVARVPAPATTASRRRSRPPAAAPWRASRRPRTGRRSLSRQCRTRRRRCPTTGGS